jgi:hypothetical protein
MTILDICSDLDHFDREGVIFAERGGEGFAPHSRAQVVVLDQGERQVSAVEIATKHCPGLSYCLELSIAREAMEVWSRWRGGEQPGVRDRAEALCYKANNDAWGPPNFPTQTHAGKS